jgi:hypothetical protein
MHGNELAARAHRPHGKKTAELTLSMLPSHEPAHLTGGDWIVKRRRAVMAR